MHADYDTAAGTLGTNRESMKHNTLLLRPPLGKATCWGDDVEANATYGFCPPSLPGGVPQAMVWNGDWSLRRRHKGQRDFIALNKASVRAGLCTARQAQEFRETHEILRNTDRTKEDKSGWPMRNLRSAPVTKVAGLKSQPEVIWDVMAMQYQADWIDRIKSKQNVDAINDPARMLPLSKFYETRASILRQHHNDAAARAFWQLPEFRAKATSKVSTHH